MQNNSRILDCTIRDGGYYNKWNFSKSFLNDYLKLIDILNIEWVEIGFRKLLQDKSYGNFIRSDEIFLNKIKFPKKVKVAVMIDCADFKSSNNYEILKKIFPKKNKSKVSMIRIASSYEDLIYLKKIVSLLKKKNYSVSVNLMKFTLLKDTQISNFFLKLKKLNCDFFYLADSFGNCKPSQFKKILQKIRKKFDLSSFGYHGHNNFNLAYKNALVGKKLGIGLIDTSINGMGRGAGNLLLEDYLRYDLEKYQKKLLKKFLSKHIAKLKKNYSWGPNSAYYYSAKNNIHPTYVQNLLSEKKFNLSSIKSILNFLKTKNSKTYDPNIFDNFFLELDKNKNSNFIYPYKDISLLCNNQSLKNKKFHSKNSNSRASLNFNQFVKQNKYDYLFVCHPFRLLTEFNSLKKLNKKLILPKFKILNKINKNPVLSIFYNFIQGNKLIIKKNYCSYSKNLVLIYALSFCLEKKIKEINIYGLSNNKSNNEIVKIFNNYIKKTRSKTLIKVI
jgi:4-hydroxy 2-oxovalerate aldolase